MTFLLEITIDAPRQVVFEFMRDKESVERSEDSPIRALEKLTPGPVSAGRRYREVVRMLPFYHGEIRAVVTRFEPGEWLAEEWTGPAMRGKLTYQFQDDRGGTRLIQQQTLHPQGALKLFGPIIKVLFGAKLKERLMAIKQHLEAKSAA